MRKSIYYGLSVLLILAVIGIVSAAENDSTAVKTYAGPAYPGPGFVDADGDGICDNMIDENGDGINDQRGYRGAGHMGKGAGFVDSDGDGICDHLTDDGMKYRRGGRNK
ncbi:MAG: hypothetical protein WA144_06675 [Candidatus Methanoperedens sp.]